MSILSIKQLKHQYQQTAEEGSDLPVLVNAIDGVSLEVEQGQFIAILGKNGSGKSSLARHINGLLFPTEGSVEIYGLDTRQEQNLPKIRQSAGIVFQNPDNQIVGTMVEEDVAFGPENIGVPTKEIWKRVGEALESVGMTAYRESSPGHLSGGQKQRIAIAGIMAMEPECLILDEPTAMLDPQGRKDVMSLVKRLNEKRNITIILITHDMEEVLHADTIFVMKDGQIKKRGTPAEVFSSVEEMKSIGLEVPYATELAFELRKEGIHLPETIISGEELVQALCQLH